jgi:hypothetical protein
VLIGLAPIAGCGESSGVDPNIKVEQGKSVQESVKAKPGAVAKKDAAPVQRKSAGPE